MINSLKNQLQNKIGKKIQSRGDCEFIANAILETLDIEISYNTIRRLYGLAPATIPQPKTLNTIAQFLGFKNYAHFTLSKHQTGKTDLSQLVYNIVHRGDQTEIINLVKSTRRSTENFTLFTVILFRELLHHNDIKLLRKLLDLDELQFDKFTYSEVLYFGNSIGLLLRNYPERGKELLFKSNFIHNVYLIFVDYSKLNGYYGDWTEQINLKAPSKAIGIFTSSILEFRKFLNLKKPNFPHDKLLYSKKLNPILCSRLIALKLMSTDTTRHQKILKKYFTIHTKKSLLMDYSHELFTSAILTKNRDLMKFLIHKIDWHAETSFYYHKYHLNSFYLMAMFYYRLTGNNREETRFEQLFNLENCVYSYQEFINLLFLIFRFDQANSPKLKNAFQLKYMTLSKKLNYPLFSEKYLVSYFQELPFQVYD